MLKLIVAVNNHWTIGLDNKMPWHCKEDLAYFKEVTMGKTVIMGRKTFESILSYGNKPLPGRKHIVLTKDRTYQYIHEDVLIVDDLDAVLEAVKEEKEDCFLLGGASLYKQCLHEVDEILLTKIDNDVIGDAFFPELSFDEWQRQLVKEGEEAIFYKYTRIKK